MALSQTEVRIIGNGRMSNPAIPVPLAAFREVVVTEETIVDDLSPIGAAAETIDSYEDVTVDVRHGLVLNHLINALSPRGEVVAIIAEPIENHPALHITTFVTSLDDETRDAVYQAEIDLMDSFKDMTFDFHLRQPEMFEDVPAIPPAPYALVWWHRV